MYLKNSINKSPFGLVINWRFHIKNRWVSIFAPHLVKEFIKTFNPLIISSQVEYNLLKRKIKYILSMEPGWAAPKINYDKGIEHIICVMASDHHNKTLWFKEYVLNNGINFVLSQYYTPFFYHFPGFPRERFCHFPWAVPDRFIEQSPIKSRSNGVIIFGGKRSDAYDLRNWCRSQPNIINYNNSGVENKKYSDYEYYRWLAGFDAIIAAGSSDPQYDLVTPKYFEIAAAGALLIGQYCTDLERLGFNESNCVIFQKDTFNKLIQEYKANHIKYLNVRENGKNLIAERHLVSHRIELLKKLFKRN